LFHLKFAREGHPVKTMTCLEGFTWGIVTVYGFVFFFSGKRKGIRGTFDITPIRKGENHHPNSSIFVIFLGIVLGFPAVFGRDGLW